MTYKVLLTLDLENDVSDSKRDKFYDYLEDNFWKKIPNLTTAWKRDFYPINGIASVVRITKQHIKDAAKGAGIKTYHAAFQIGEGKVELV